ncbi:hypothetical protein HQQ80_12375 [Microbacteriaceae bacterium VKM Ac-2855]|nr:hypothetical protein [Microbacteriaceae bacterium VKM Ac-2855]
MSRMRAVADPMRTLDEKFVSNAIAFEIARPTATMVFDSAPFRKADGSLDRALLNAGFEQFLLASQAMRMKLRRAPFGLFTPSWVSAKTIDLRKHLRYHPGVVDWDTRHVALATGPHNGTMDPRGPLWDALVIELSNGDLACPVRIHHAIGDGMFGLFLISKLLRSEPEVLEPETRDVIDFPDDPPAPRGPIALTIAARRSVAARYANFAEEWADWKRKPLIKRLKRVGGRNIRAIRDVYIRRSGLFERTVHAHEAAILRVELKAAKAGARAAGGSVADLTVALALRGFAALHPDTDSTSILVPVSPQRDRDESTRNHVSMVRVAVPTALSLTETIAAVRAQVQLAVQTGESGIVRGKRDWLGYASYLPVFPRPMFFGPSAVRAMTLWPVTEPEDEGAVFASSYTTHLDVAVNLRADLDSDLFVRTIADGLAEIGAPVLDGAAPVVGADR